MGGTAIYAGAGYGFGPERWYRSPSLELVRQFWVPVPVWGVIMVVAGILIFTRWRPYGHFVAMLLWAFWFACIATVSVFSLIATIFHANLGLPPVGGWGAPAYVLVYMMVHMHMIVGPGQKVYLVPTSHEDAEPREDGDSG